jgi:Amt family ammonium transporter
MVVMYAVNATGTLRVSAEGELYGLDLHEHGISAYPEYVISPLGAPAGMAAVERAPVTVARKANAAAAQAESTAS